MTAISRERVQEDSSGIDLTPMLDVVFIMLIFFIVTASFIREVTIQIERPPQTQSTATDENKNIVVKLQADNQIFIDNRAVDHRSLRAYFERHLASNPQSSLIIDAKNASKTLAVARIADAAREAGLYRIILANND